MDLFNAHVVSWLHTLARAMIPYGVRKDNGEWARAHGMRRSFVTPTDMRCAWKEGRWYAPPRVVSQRLTVMEQMLRVGSDYMFRVKVAK